MARTVAERITKWETIRDSAEDRLAECLANPKPNYSDGECSYSWTEYQAMLNRQIKEAEAQIAALGGESTMAPAEEASFPFI